MKLCCGLMGRADVGCRSAAVAGRMPRRRCGRVLSNEEVLLPQDADFGEFTIAEATEEERRTMQQAGYNMADWTLRNGWGAPAAMPTTPTSKSGRTERRAAGVVLLGPAANASGTSRIGPSNPPMQTRTASSSWVAGSAASTPPRP